MARDGSTELPRTCADGVRTRDLPEHWALYPDNRHRFGPRRTIDDSDQRRRRRRSSQSSLRWTCLRLSPTLRPWIASYVEGLWSPAPRRSWPGGLSLSGGASFTSWSSSSWASPFWYCGRFLNERGRPSGRPRPLLPVSLELPSTPPDEGVRVARLPRLVARRDAAATQRPAGVRVSVKADHLTRHLLKRPATVAQV
jgi:hypothetical protein